MFVFQFRTFQEAKSLLKWSLSSLPETLRDSLIVLPESWHCRPNTLPVSREIFGKNCTVTIVTIRNGLPTKISFAISISIVRMSLKSSISANFVVLFFLFLVVAKSQGRDVFSF